jgi:exodeoxyribonuclease VIII
MMKLTTIPAHEYHAIDALSASGLKLLAKSPAHYQNNKIYERLDTAAFKRGRALHSLVLEPELKEVSALDEDALAAEYEAEKGKPCSTLASTSIYKAAEAGFKQQYPNAILLRQGEYEALKQRAETVRNHPDVKELFKTGMAEQSLIVENDGIKLKCRFDWVCTKRHIIVDLKATEEASPDSFARQSDRYNYHWQAHWYTYLYRIVFKAIPQFYFVCSENRVPYELAVYKVQNGLGSVIDLAAKETAPLVEKYKECLKSGVWHGYETQDLPMTSWQESRLNMVEGFEGI